MQQFWSLLTSHLPPFVMFTIVPTIVVNLTYLLATLVTVSFEWVPAFRKYKIQSNYNPPAKFWRCVKALVGIKLLSEIPLTLSAYPMFRLLGMRYDLPLPGAGWIALQLVVFFFVEDAWHYFGHRILHTRWGYKKIHFKHHEFTTPFGVAANYAHPAETVFLGFGTILPVLIFRPHLFTMCVWIMARQIQAISVHCGYDFPWSLGRWVPFVGGARFHDRHHVKFIRNYAPTFTWLDRWLGTAEQAQQQQQAQQQRKAA